MLRRRFAKAAGTLGLGLLAGIVIYWRKNPSACPYSQRFFLELPRPFMGRSQLRGILAPTPGERILEVGPGTGYYALHTARWLEPGGALEVLDLQQRMLDHTARRAQALGVSNIIPARGDARSLPYPDGSFDAVYLVAALGEVPDQGKALNELYRVLKTGGRLVVGESIPDPHMVPFETLRARAEAAGLRFEYRLGGRPIYLARFRATGLKPGTGHENLSVEREGQSCS